MKIKLPEFSLVLLMGASGAGKSTFARRHFLPTEILSSDTCRGLVSDDENSMEATDDAFEILHTIAEKRLARRLLTVIDATNVQPFAREKFRLLARRYHALLAAIVFELPEAVHHQRNQERPDRNFGPHVVRNQVRDLKRSLRQLKKEGVRNVTRLRTPEEVEAVTIERQPLWNNLRHDSGPFDIIGDVHGCFDELESLLQKLGYSISPLQETAEDPAETLLTVHHPEGRKLLFVGDLVDRGPRSVDVLRLAMGAVESGTGLCVPGNHDVKLLRWLRGKRVNVRHGLAETVAQMTPRSDDFRQRLEKFLNALVSHYVLDEGRLVVAHAGLREDLQGRASGAVRSFALYGETDGETDEFGLPIRYNWAAEYRGKAKVVYGHTPVPEAEWLGKTLCIDTGCVFGGHLTALRYPERELVSVAAQKIYSEPVKPPVPTRDLPVRSGLAQPEGPPLPDNLIDLEDVSGKRRITTRLRQTVTLRPEQTTAALEVMSRFAVDPRWLIYLPPTMAPPPTAPEGGRLEHPAQVFEHYRQRNVSQVLCEEKHMGSRAVLVICRDAAAARLRFRTDGEEAGICYTRTGRRFFNDPSLEEALLDRLRKALDSIDLWRRLETDWVCVDAELMPWSAKAQALLLTQYAPIAAAGGASLADAEALLSQATARGVQVDDLLTKQSSRRQQIAKYVEAYGHYCWPVNSLEDFALAPFHLLASEGKVHSDKPHSWHMELLHELCAAAPEVLQATACHLVDLEDEASRHRTIEEWERLTDAGGEGMVIKPMNFIPRNEKGLLQPAIKCRGQEYLRIIYGPEYTAPENLKRLRQRHLGRKSSLALREFTLGLEALERFVEKRPLREVHECVFGILALESEPVDPRL